MAKRGIDSFKANITGVYYSNLYEVLITQPPFPIEEAPGGLSFGNDTGLLCLTAEAVNMPGRTLDVVALGGSRYPSYELPVGYKNEDVTITYMLTSGYKVRQFFETWITNIVNYDTYLLSYPDKYTTTIEIRQLDNQHNAIYTCTLDEAYPKNITNISFASTSTEYTKFDVVFAYRNYHTETI